MTIWKYTAHMHIIAHHSLPFDDSGDSLVAVPAQMAIDMFITCAEESKMGIASTVTAAFRDDYDLPDSDMIEPVLAATKREREDSDNESDTSITIKVRTHSKRPRSGTYSRVYESP